MIAKRSVKPVLMTPGRSLHVTNFFDCVQFAWPIETEYLVACTNHAWENPAFGDVSIKCGKNKRTDLILRSQRLLFVYLNTWIKEKLNLFWTVFFFYITEIKWLTAMPVISQKNLNISSVIFMLNGQGWTCLFQHLMLNSFHDENSNISYYWNDNI